MANYRDLASQKIPSLAEMIAAMKAKRTRGPQPPPDAAGDPVNVYLGGEAPIQAQPVSGGPTIEVGTPQIAPRVTVGRPVRSMTTAPVNIPDPRNAQLRQLMASGMTFEQAIRRIQAGG